MTRKEPDGWRAAMQMGSVQILQVFHVSNHFKCKMLTFSLNFVI